MEHLIKLLPEHISNQIAAGEVIQRPASVVKELVENAIDAGATAIEVFIKQAGKSSIKVVDNGCGIALFDTKMAFERHATSKISNVNDLFDLHTKGFRGEALASIASIAHVELKTKRKSDELGTLVVNEGGEIKIQEPTVCKDGTSFEIKNLFYNVPARRNFLKSDSVEFKHIEEEFLRIALIHTGISLSLFHNEEAIYQLPQSNERRRLVDIYGKSMNDKLIPIEENSDLVNISGFVVKPEFSRKQRGQQYLFVNNRFFKDSYFHNAIVKAYGTLIVDKTFPGYFLNFEVDPSRIDINVHPTKTEIKFEYQKDIYMILNSAVKQSLGKFNIFPTMDFEAETAFDLPYEMRNEQPIEPHIKVNQNYNPFAQFGPSSSKTDADYANKSLRNFGFGHSAASSDEWKDFYSIEKEQENTQQDLISSPSSTETEEINFEKADLTLLEDVALLKINNRNIFAISLSRAQERVIYDELMRTFFVQEITVQTLLFPIEMNASHQEKLAWDEHQKTIFRLGFRWNFENEILSITAVPSLLPKDKISSVTNQAKELIQNETFDKNDLAHLLIDIIAFSSSNGYLWTIESARDMLQNWWQCSEKWESPSGKIIAKGWNSKDLIN